MADRQLQGKLIENLVPDHVDFGKNPYYDDEDVFDVFTDMLITGGTHLTGPSGEREDMRLTAHCSLWKADASGGPPMPCGPPLYVGPMGNYPSSTSIDDPEWRRAADKNPNRNTRMSSTGKSDDGMGGSVCKVPVAYHISAERLGADRRVALVESERAAFELLWRSLVSVDKEGSITVSSLQKDVCGSSGSTSINPLLEHGLELTVTPYLWRPYDPPADYKLSSQRALPSVKFTVSWTWISYSPTLMTAVLGNRAEHGDNYYMYPFVSPSLAKYREGGDETQRKIREGQKTQMSPFYYMGGYAYKYNLKYTVEPESGGSWPYPVKVDAETGVVVVSAPKPRGHTTKVKTKGKIVVEVDPAKAGASAGAGFGMASAGFGLTDDMGFPRTFPIEIEWMTQDQWYQGVNDDAAKGAGNPTPAQTLPAPSGDRSVNSGSNSSANPDTGGCTKPQPPLGLPNKYSAAVAKGFNSLGKPSCYTMQAQAGGSAGFGLVQGGASLTIGAGCEQIVAQMSNFNSFNQSLACQFNNVQSQGSAFAAAYTSIDFEVGGNFTMSGDSNFSITTNQAQKVKMKASLRSVNQQTLSAVMSNAVKSTAKSKIKWANGSGSTPHGSKSIKQLTQNANQIANSQNINKVMQAAFGGIYANSRITVKIGGDMDLKDRAKFLLTSNQQQDLVVTSFTKSALGSATSNVMTNEVTDSMSSDVVDMSKGVFDGVADMTRAAQAGFTALIWGGVILGVVTVICGVLYYVYAPKNPKKGLAKLEGGPPKTV